MEPIHVVSGTLVVLPKDNIDTDQIIPARFLKVTDKQGLGDCLFYDWRYDAQGNPHSDFVLNGERGHRAKFLLTGDNFGCGSSREHAPWALRGYGFAAVISASFADIFRNNSLKNGLLPVAVSAEERRDLLRLIEAEPELPLTLDLESQTLQICGLPPICFSIDPFSKKCLLKGIDELGYLLQNQKEIETYRESHPPRVSITPLASPTQ